MVEGGAWDEGGGAGYFAFPWYEACVLSVMVCLLPFSVIGRLCSKTGPLPGHCMSYFTPGINHLNIRFCFFVVVFFFFFLFCFVFSWYHKNT